MSNIVLVNDHDEIIGSLGKLAVHELGLLHRAFSIFVFNSKHELLLQKRALHKYHSGGKWSNTCCSHQTTDDILINLCHQRLKFEMGIDCELKELSCFIYKANLDHHLIEHEFDHVFVGVCDDVPRLNKLEVMDSRYLSIDDLKQEITEHPDDYTEWLKLILGK